MRAKMKITVTVDVPESMERQVKILDKIDHDQVGLRDLFDSLNGNYSVNVSYPAMSRDDVYR